MNLVTIGNMQSGLFTNWLIFNDPFTFIIFWVYFTCAVASVNRAPFDLAEAESELVAGFHTEYSGLRWSFFFMAEYGSMFLVSGLAAILFFGGWHGPIPIAGPIATTFVNIITFGNGASWEGLSTYMANFMGCVNFLFKGFVGVTVMMWIRWTLPRLRIDQVITTCLKYCVPLAAVCFLGAMFWQLFDGPTGNDLVGPSRGLQTESWVDAADRALQLDVQLAPDAAIEDSPAADEAVMPVAVDRVIKEETGGPAEKGGAG
jgi:NADH-quinone oxidoreductase subunit H